MENETAIAKKPENEVPQTFESVMQRFDEKYKQMFEAYLIVSNDPDSLRHNLDKLRKDTLPEALQLAETKVQYKQVLKLLPMKEDAQQRAEIKSKIKSLKA
jgi:hypothetical protein